jgi:hypothetical protein
LVFDVNAGPYRSDVTRFKFRKKIVRQHVITIAVVVQKHRQIEMQIDHSCAMYSRDPVVH